MTATRITSAAGALLLMAAVSAGVFFLIRSLPSENQPVEVPTQPVSTQAPPFRFPPAISVTAKYPGANAQVVIDSVAAPIEEQVSGVENLVSMNSAAGSDGSYTLHLTFKKGSDLDMTQVLVQNRVALATPVLPTLVQNEGISVRKMVPQPLLLVSLTSPDARFDSLYLSNYAIVNIKDELSRVPGVAEVVLFGQRDQRLILDLDVEKMAALAVSPLDVVNALEQQNIQVVASSLGQPPVPKGLRFRMTLTPLDRLRGPAAVADVILKTGQPGEGDAIVRLRDVGHVQAGGSEGGNASLDGKPAVVLGIHPLPNARPSQVSQAVADKLAELRKRAPKGVDLAVAFDFSANLDEPDRPTTPEHLVLDVQLPDSASMERTIKTLEEVQKVVRATSGIQRVLALTEHPFSPVRNRPCLIVGLTPKESRQTPREQIAEQLRTSLDVQILDALVLLSLPSTEGGFPIYGWPIDIGIQDRTNRGLELQQRTAEAFIDKMMQTGKFSHPRIDPGVREVPGLLLDIDRARCQALGVEANEVFNTLQVYLGSYYVQNFNAFSRTWQVNVPTDQRFRDPADIRRLQVRDKQGQLVQFGDIMTIRDTRGRRVIERHDLYPIVRITANLAKDVSPAEARELCDRLAEEGFDTKTCLVWRP